MIIKLVGTGSPIEQLQNLVSQALSELALTDAVQIETTDDAAYKLELGITKNPALCIEESSIEFKDMIFQGEVPAYEEIKSMFISILGDDESHGDSCSTGESCGTGGCGDCSCH